MLNWLTLDPKIFANFLLSASLCRSLDAEDPLLQITSHAVADNLPNEQYMLPKRRRLKERHI